MEVPLHRFSPEVQRAFRCPICRSKLQIGEAALHCQSGACGFNFCFVRDVPILLNENQSIFSIESYLRDERPKNLGEGFHSKEMIRNLLPGISRNVLGARNFQNYTNLLLSASATPRVLVVGGKNQGEGFDVLLEKVPPVELVETDVVFGPRTMLICDSHDLPFQDSFFDGVVVQAVLEHVADPYRCVDEIFRVLRPAGLVYAETPFIQQVHEGSHDFTRFTHLGHRRLFRRFEEVSSGPVCGAGMALAWSYRHFLLSLSDSSLVRNLMDTLARLTSFYLKYFDDFTITNAGTFDSASANFFLGRKSESILSDRELVGLYRGRM